MDNREVIQPGLDYIEDNLKADLQAGELAEAAGFSLFHYYRLFRSATGLPVMQYILRRRLLHAVYAIRRGSSGIEAALTYGFDTYAGFYKAFQREFDCTPSDYLRANRAKRPCRPNLFKEEPMTLTHKRAAEILRHWNLEGEALSDIYSDSTGSQKESALYVSEDYVLKFTADLEKLQNHTRISAAMEGLGLYGAVPIPAADGREYIQDGPLYFCLTRRFSGEPIRTGDLYQGDTGSKARFVGEILGQLHVALSRVDRQVPEADTLETVRSWALPKVRAALSLSDSFCRDYLDAFARLYPVLPRQIIHRDPNPGNILQADSHWGFLDLELSERNARIYDPCYAATAVLSESFGKDNRKWLEIYRNILLGYDSVATLSEEERQAVPYVLLANQLVCTAWFAEQEKFAELFEVNRHMTLWMIDHFEELSL